MVACCTLTINSLFSLNLSQECNTKTGHKSFSESFIILKMNFTVSVCSFDGVNVGADVPGLHEEGSTAKMGTSAGNHTVII